MKKKLLVAILSVSLLATGLMGCGNTKSGEQAERAEAETEQENQGEQLESGKVALRIWVEEANIENLQKMIDSFDKSMQDRLILRSRSSRQGTRIPEIMC